MEQPEGGAAAAVASGSCHSCRSAVGRQQSGRRNGENMWQKYAKTMAKKGEKRRKECKNADFVTKMTTKYSKIADYIDENPTMWQKRWLYSKNSVANMPTLWQKCRLCGKSSDCMAKIPTMWQKCRQCDKKFTIQYMSKRIGRTITMNKKLITRGIQEKSRKANILQIVLFSEDIFQIGTETSVVSLPNPSAKNCNCSSTKEP